MKSIYLIAIPVALAVCVSTGYGQESETGEEESDFAKVAAMLHGVWAGDAEKTAEEIKKMEGLDLEESDIESALARVKSIELEFQDGTFNVVIGDQEMSGKWKVTSTEKKDDTQTLAIHVMPGESGTEKKFEIHFMGEKHMKMIDLDEESPPFVMARKKVRSNDQ